MFNLVLLAVCLGVSHKERDTVMRILTSQKFIMAYITFSITSPRCECHKHLTAAKHGTQLRYLHEENEAPDHGVVIAHIAPAMRSSSEGQRHWNTYLVTEGIQRLDVATHIMANIMHTAYVMEVHIWSYHSKMLSCFYSTGLMGFCEEACICHFNMIA